ncbi:hypothetical protein J3R30DRAFT_3290821 [Lentinula aciculospora]|uniref:Arrestin-like N-terminal domain-containing protein n=1 Tax=Lentinula aciculospora TaxID=153920 RepID=A0A9W9AA09_9AGAR|nr:hypothetical protein J3R30DRAFT_3290821 [Lentinula aciculospora]
MESSFDYSNFVHGDNSLPQSVTSLPAYSRRPSPPPRARRGLTEHVVELSSDITNKRAKTWATLRVYSKAPAATLPTFAEGEKITGSVTLDSKISNSRHISCVKVIVSFHSASHVEKRKTGRFRRRTRRRLSVDRVTFLETSTTLWSKDVHATRQNGMHWPFSIHLPGEVVVSSGTMNVQAYALPPTFMERNTRACIRYNLIVHISRSKFREDSNLQMTWIYIPATKPDPPSPLRQLAYQENSPLLGPQDDPRGWYTLPSTKVYGTLFKNRVVEVTLNLSLAQPLSYTRGSVIPVSLTLSSTDSQALDLLSSRQSLTVRLRRKVTSNSAQTFAELNAPWNATQGAILTEPTVEIADAVWWQRPGSVNINETIMNSTMQSKTRLYREMEGEILLPKNLKPTFRISHFGIEYSVVLLPFDTTGFAPSTPAAKFYNGPILEQRVEIVTMFPRGPRPISHSPPGYQEQATHATRSPLPSGRTSVPPSRGR